MNKLIRFISFFVLIALITACAPSASATDSPDAASIQVEQTVQAPLVITTATLPADVSPTNTIAAEAPTTLPTPVFAVTNITYTVSTWSDLTTTPTFLRVDCPLVTATITANGAGTVNYYWLSVGISDQIQESRDEDLIFDSAGTKTVSLRFQVESTSSERAALIYITSPSNPSFAGSDTLTPCSTP